MNRSHLAFAVLLNVALASSAFVKAATDASPFANLHYRNIGPTTGRIDTVTGIPGDPTTYFAGGLGGLWRTRDGGMHWSPVFDDKPVTSIGDVVVAPSNHKIVYVGTGEPNIRNDIAFGDGVWRSNDGGSTWTHVGLDATSQIAQIAIAPKNAAVAYVAAVGDPFSAGPSRGIYKTTDAGEHWQRILFGDDTTGASSVVISPASSKIVYAGLWTVQRRPWMLTSGGSADGLFRSTDAGAHWTRVRGDGFPAGLTGRIGLAFAPSDPRILYALVESKAGVLWNSRDGGYHWKLISDQHVLAQRPYYFTQLTVDPKDPNHVFFMSIVPSESRNGGKTITRMSTSAYDHHQIWIDPVRDKRAIIGADAGVRLSLDAGKNWRDPQLIVSQPYHISVDNGAPYTVCGEFQDPGAACGPSASFSGGITPDQWFSPQAGESGWIVFSPANPNIIYGTGYEENVSRFDKAAMQARTISPWPDTYAGLGAQSYKYRGAWVAPVAVSPLEPNTLYFGTQYLMKTDDGGQTWAQVSPDLTRDDKTKQVPSGRPITVDNAGTEVYDTIASIAESPTVKGELWVGTDDGFVWLSRDGGTHWANVSAAIPGLPHWARINNVDPSRQDGTAYIVAENHKLGDRAPYLYVTHDFGAHWSSIVGNLPRDSYGRMIREDPFRERMLYAGTENGLWFSYDEGAHWESLLHNLAHAPVYDFVVQPQFDDLVVATHGRGVWILDDISPLQKWSAQIQRSPSYLFPVRPAYRWNASWSTWATGEGAGENPTDLAVINFYLRDAPAKKGPAVQVQIYDGPTLVRTLKVEKPVVGINRVWWDLNYDAIKTIPNYHATRNGFMGPQVLPGTYAVRLVANGKMTEQYIKVLPDLKTPGSLADMQAGYALAMRLRADYRSTGNEIVALRALHDSLAQASRRHGLRSDTRTALSALQSATDDALTASYTANAQSWEDTLRAGPGLYERILNLAQGIVGTDYRPTAGQTALADDIEAQMKSRLGDDDALFGPRLANLNGLLKRDNQPAITVKRE